MEVLRTEPARLKDGGEAPRVMMKEQGSSNMSLIPFSPNLSATPSKLDYKSDDP